jgi:hypothetical protein
MKTFILLNVIIAAVYAFVGKAALSLAFLHPSVTAVWPSTGIAVAACLLFNYRVWPGVLVSAFMVNQAITGTTMTSAAIAAGNTMESLLGTYLLNHFAGGRKAFWQAEGVLKVHGPGCSAQHDRECYHRRGQRSSGGVCERGRRRGHVADVVAG